MTTISETTRNFDRLADAFHSITANTVMKEGPLVHPVFAFTGLAGSGKDSAADALQTCPFFAKVSFADPIRDMLSAIGVPVKAIYERNSPFGKEDPLPNFCGVSLRRMMQTLGTEWGRDQIDPNFWVALTSHKIQRNRNLKKFSVITDLRFDNEAKMIKDLGGVIIKINAAGKSFAGSTYSHTSESGIDSKFIDYIMTNWFSEPAIVSKYNFMSDVLRLVANVMTEKPVAIFTN